ncbi:MAG: hypothetical protein ACE5K0_04710 [Candidatus Methanofastidiosia archaeon]
MSHPDISLEKDYYVAEEKVQEKKMKIVELDADAENPKAKRLYEGCGFREVRRGICYRKKL